MQFDPQQFENFLAELSRTRTQVDAIMSRAVGMHELSETGMLLLWQSIFDTMMTTQDPEERLKWGTLIEKVFSALTARRALELRENKTESSKSPLDAPSMSELSAKLKLL